MFINYIYIYECYIKNKLPMEFLSYDPLGKPMSKGKFNMRQWSLRINVGFYIIFSVLKIFNMKLKN